MELEAVCLPGEGLSLAAEPQKWEYLPAQPITAVACVCMTGKWGGGECSCWSYPKSTELVTYIRAKRERRDRNRVRRARRRRAGDPQTQSGRQTERDGTEWEAGGVGGRDRRQETETGGGGVWEGGGGTKRQSQQQKEMASMHMTVRESTPPPPPPPIQQRLYSDFIPLSH